MTYALYRKGILGTKVGMTQVFAEDGDAHACTLVEAGPCAVTQVKTKENDAYSAVQLGYRPARSKVTTKPMQGHFKKAGVEPTRWLREVRLDADAADDVKAGGKVTCDTFVVGEYVDVIGTMKGRGFTGVVKRHGFATHKESHGAHFYYRHGGSIGCRKPQHTRKGIRMAGHHGASRVTVQNLRVLRVDPERNLLYILGAVPGPNGGLLLVRQAKKRRDIAVAPVKAAPAAPEAKKPVKAKK
jgi:large subunit ribosomal protein L3